ncbi:hypothetical protein ACF08M_11985 [Streptomyces sp. NPDC015032]|uniref:hypothetical protein n=1 Tax=Streptomyces sp. NPDC015032 TaxID=3364937 RepID=UPI0036F9C7D4
MKKSGMAERPAGLRGAAKPARGSLDGSRRRGPRTMGPRWFRAAAVSGLVLSAAILNAFNAIKRGAGSQIGAIGLLLAGIRTAALVAVPYRPVQAW